ncbi:MAG: ABC transporter substrate-binding protein [Terriglobales bacterium]
MRLTGFRRLVVSSLLLATLALAETRPHYGGTLHMSTRASPASLDPAQPEWMASRTLFPLIFDTLISFDQRGRLQPGLATSWEAETGNQRWQIALRQGATFQDGSLVTSETVAASLRSANPAWKVVAGNNAVTIERDSPAPDLSAELALPRNSIVKRESGRVIGTGPFAVSQWDPGKKLVLSAREDYWGGRPFLDAIEVDLGRSLREQEIAFELGKAQINEIAPELAHSTAAQGRRIESSYPVELVALVFTHDPQSPEDVRLRDALSLSIDRKQLNTVLVQDAGEPAGGLLPNWMTGYGVVFPTEVDLTRAQQERAEIARAPLWNLGLDANDPLERVIAERLVLNAREAGLRLQLANGGTADLRLVRIPLASLEPHVALRELASAFGFSTPKFSNSSMDDLYAAENSLLQSKRVIPLLHLRSAAAVSELVKGWSESPDGGWRLADVWLSAEKP